MSKEFYDAAVFADMPKLKSMVGSDAGIVNSTHEWGFTSLHGVAGEEHYDVAAYLIDHGADVNAKNAEGIAPLQLAAWPKMIELLVSRGADIEVVDMDGRTPLIVHAEEADDCDVIEALLRLGANPDAADNNGHTALSIAMDREETDKIRLLKSHSNR